MESTPGPWKIANNKGHIEIVPDTPEWLCAIGKVYKSGKMNANRYTMPYEANARLIAAAPELLDALKSIATIVKGSKAQMENQISFARRTATEAIRKVGEHAHN